MNKITSCISALIFIISTVHCYSQGIVINEILASNSTINTDEDGDHHDWVELYNTSGAAVNLNDYSLSDDPLVPAKWTFPNITMASVVRPMVSCCRTVTKL